MFLFHTKNENCLNETIKYKRCFYFLLMTTSDKISEHKNLNINADSLCLIFSLEECCIIRYDGGDIKDGGQNNTVPAFPECSIMSDDAALRTLHQRSDITLSCFCIYSPQAGLVYKWAIEWSRRTNTSSPRVSVDLVFCFENISLRVHLKLPVIFFGCN